MWFQLQIKGCPTNQVELLSEELELSGALSIMLTDKHDVPVLEPLPGTMPLWPEVIIHALYDNLYKAESTQDNLKNSKPYLDYQIEKLPEQDWERAWMQDFKPQRFGEKLWICPSWHTPPDSTAVNLMLDPGLAFGTGSHPTTSLCLTWLEQANLNDKSLIDYGCGSGILSLAALKLGAKLVYAVDIDAQALQATQSNAQENAISSQSLILSTPEILTNQVDILIANILLEPLLSLKVKFQKLLKPEGTLVLSGVLEEQTDILINNFKQYFTPIKNKTLDGWSLLVFIKN